LPRSIEAPAASPRQDQDETGHQSVQDAAGIKQNNYAFQSGALRRFRGWPAGME
jgi:hypothetical protein